MQRPEFLRQPSEKTGMRHSFFRFGSVLRSPLVTAAIAGGVLFLGGGLVAAGGTLGRAISNWLDSQIESQARSEYETQLAAETAAAHGQAQARLLEMQARALSTGLDIERRAAEAAIADTRESMWIARAATNIGDIGCALEHASGDAHRDLCDGVTALRRHMSRQYAESLEEGRGELARQFLEGMPSPHAVLEPELEAARSRYAQRPDESE